MSNEVRPTQAAPTSPGLVRGLGLLDSTMLVAGSMIGSGIFVVSADIARQLGSPGLLLAVWLVTGVLTIFAALSYGELAAMMPRAGGQYVYLREAFGPMWGFLYGWALFLVIQTGTIAAVAVAFAKFCGVLAPGLSETHHLVAWGRFAISPATLLAIAVLVLLSWTNSTGLRTGKLVQNAFTVAKIAALAGLVLLGCLLSANSTAMQANFGRNFWTAGAGTTPGAAGGGALALAFGTAMVGSLFSADAWNNITFTAGEVEKPQRNLPLSLALGVGLVVLLYLATNVAYLLTLPLHGVAGGASPLERGIQFAANDRVATAAVEVMFGSGAAVIMAVLIMVSTFGCLNGMILAGARVYYAMAQDGLFLRGVGKLNARGVPASGLAVQCFWACLLTLSGTYSDLLDYVIFAVLVFYVLTIGGLFVLRRRQPEAPRPYRALGYPFIPAIYMGVASLIAMDLLVAPKTRGNTWPGLLIVLSGVPVYFAWRRRARKRMAPDR